MFFVKFADEGDNPVNNPNMYNVEGDDRLSPDLQHLTTGSVLKIRVFSVWFHNCIFYSRNHFVVSCKIKHSIYKHLVVSFGIIKQLLPSYEVDNQVVKTTILRLTSFDVGIIGRQ